MLLPARRAPSPNACCVAGAEAWMATDASKQRALSQQHRHPGSGAGSATPLLGACSLAPWLPVCRGRTARAASSGELRGDVPAQAPCHLRIVTCCGCSARRCRSFRVARLSLSNKLVALRLVLAHPCAPRMKDPAAGALMLPPLCQPVAQLRSTPSSMASLRHRRHPPSRITPCLSS